MVLKIQSKALLMQSGANGTACCFVSLPNIFNLYTMSVLQVYELLFDKLSPLVRVTLVTLQIFIFFINIL